jgi:hypothetical protein
MLRYLSTHSQNIVNVHHMEQMAALKEDVKMAQNKLEKFQQQLSSSRSGEAEQLKRLGREN